MSFFRKLFGGGDKTATDTSAAQVDYNGYLIETTPMPEGGQFRVCATISKDVDGATKTHQLIRADICSTAQEASDMAIRKSKQVIDERGDRLFDV